MSRAPTDDQMTDDQTAGDQRGLKRAQRDKRLAARLRDNLRRRKTQSLAQSRARAAVSEAGGGEETKGASASAPPGHTTDGKSA
jgi:hypothetical protein